MTTTNGTADGYLPIEDHGVIGNLRTVALVGTNGTIDWCCLPRFDSPSGFGALMDARRGGEFAIEPPEGRTKQLYLPGTNVLVTRCFTADSVGEIIDFMVPKTVHRVPQFAHRATLIGDEGQLMRQVRGVRGRTPFRVRCRPAFHYALAPHEVHIIDGHNAVFASERGALLLRASVPLRREDDAVVAPLELNQGEAASFALSWYDRPAEVPSDIRRFSDAEFRETQLGTMNFWDGWLQRSRYEGRYREVVERSALTLKLLTYEPTGALVAAPTSSLPEAIGFERNWDYRYTWIRDAAFSLYALMRLGLSDETEAFMTWLEARCREVPPGQGLRVLYSIDGGREPPEAELDHLEGYRGSRPVRIGNAAADQLQLDSLGELMDSVYLYDKYCQPISYDLWVALGRQLDWLDKHWEEPDDGIWEIRAARQRYTYSTLMTWVAFERANRIARRRGLPGPTEHWQDLASQAYRHVQDMCWNAEIGAYVQYPGTRALDASLLVMPLVKFTGARDPRYLSTLERIRRELALEGLVRRYESDTCPSTEGTFNLCSFWYVEAMARGGRVGRARYLFEKMLTHANHLGLYAEEIGPTGESLGNFPQAFTHLALISAAVCLDTMMRRERGVVYRSI